MVTSLRIPSLKKEKKRSQCGVQKAHTFSTHFPSAWRAAACFLTVCKIELDTVGNLTSRQTCIFFTPQVLVFPVFSLLFFPPSSFSQLQLPSDIVSALSSSIFTISPLYPPQSCPPPHQEHPPQQLTPCHQRWSETGQDCSTRRPRACALRTLGARGCVSLKGKYVAYAKPCPLSDRSNQNCTLPVSK